VANVVDSWIVVKAKAGVVLSRLLWNRYPCYDGSDRS
jgi:hypothetical protein